MAQRETCSSGSHSPTTEHKVLNPKNLKSPSTDNGLGFRGKPNNKTLAKP